mmetsp:Transcript_18741/g.32447  ORF Transcript_18741/g.32447 Transcript_18741/m.32447 type:complete len:82 (+) Transcript_18741:28-273(+)
MSRIQEIDEHIEEHEHEHFEDFSEGMLAHEYAGYAGGPDQGGAYQMDPTTQKTIFLAVTFVALAAVTGSGILDKFLRAPLT